MVTYQRRRNKVGGLRRRKRWFFNATLPKSVPFVGGAGVSFGSGKMGKRSLVKTVKRTVHKMEEAKHKIINATQTPKHDTIYTLNLLGNISQGNTGFTRNGDSVFVEAIKIRNYMEQLAANENTVFFRLLLVRHDNDHLSGSDNWGSGLGLTDIYHTGSTIAGIIQGLVDAKKVSVLLDKTYTVNKQVTGKVNVKIDSMLIPIKQKFVYKDGTNYGKFANYYLVLHAFASGGSTGTTDTGLFNTSVDVIFKDE